MTIMQAEKKIRNAWIASIIAGLLNLLFAFTVSIWSSMDALMMLIFTFGIYKKSRVAAIGMFIYFLASRIVWTAILSAAGSSVMPGILVGSAFLYFYFEGARGAIIYHRLRSSKELLTGPPVPYVYPMSVARLRKRAWLTVLLASVVVMAVIVGSIMVMDRSSGPYVGGCVAHGVGEGLKAAGCDSSEAFGRISKLNRQEVSFGSDEPDCPDDTDSFGRFDTKESTLSNIGCIRNLVSPHPGDPGRGGGILRSGDCIDSAISLHEMACSTEASGHLAGLVATPSDCPPATLDLITRNTGHRPVLCLDSGKDVLAQGDCIADPSQSIFGSPKVPCTSVDRTAIVVARAPTVRACPPMTRLTLASKSGTVNTQVLCLR